MAEEFEQDRIYKGLLSMGYKPIGNKIQISDNFSIIFDFDIRDKLIYFRIGDVESSLFWLLSYFGFDKDTSNSKEFFLNNVNKFKEMAEGKILSQKFLNWFEEKIDNKKYL